MNILLALTIAFLGFGKYPSKTEAQIACAKWVEQGPKFHSQLSAHDRKEWEYWKKNKKVWMADRMGNNYAIKQLVWLREVKVVDGKPVYGINPINWQKQEMRSYRSCKHEHVTKQYLGMQPESVVPNGVRYGRGKVKPVKYFRY